jgi:hypothetical protein
LMSEMPPSMRPIRVHTGPAKDERGRPIMVGIVNGRMEIVPNLQPVEAEKPVRLPKVAPMPHKRPGRAS